jgi:hypothetical protein
LHSIAYFFKRKGWVENLSTKVKMAGNIGDGFELHIKNLF